MPFYVATHNVAWMANMSLFIFLPLFMILNAGLVLVAADILSGKDDSASSEAAEAETSFRKAA
jgi:hypothetical protein